MAKKGKYREYPAWTPYGKSDFRKNISPDIAFFSSNGRGIFRVARSAYEDACKEQGMLPREKGRHDDDVFLWFDQKRQWAFVALAFPDAFEAFGKYFPGADFGDAERDILDYFPDYWEFWKGERVERGMSKARDYAIFLSEHRNDLMAFSFSELHPLAKFTLLLTASIGGDKRAKEKRMFVVPLERHEAKSRGQWRCRIPYLVEDGDRELWTDDLEAFKGKMAGLDKGGLFFPAALDIVDGDIHLECVSPESGEREWAVLSVPEWTGRDLLDIICFERTDAGLRRLIV